MNLFLAPLVGGSGGGGGHIASQGTTVRFGTGGGALLIASSTAITVNGHIQANGGQAGGFTFPNPGGGGAGGSIRLAAPVVNGTGVLSVLGGAGGFVSSSDGRVRIEDFQRAFRGTVTPSSSHIIASPFAVLLPPPTPLPSVRVVSIAGVPVPPNPMGSITMPDVTLNTPTTAPVQIEARHIPPGTVVQLQIYSETGTGQVVDSPP